MSVSIWAAPAMLWRKNIRTLGGSASLLSLCGQDEPAKQLQKLLDAQQINATLHA